MNLLLWQNTPSFQASEDTEFLTQQNQIGWDHILEGCFAAKWVEHQQQFYASINSKRSGLRWLIAIIKKLWDVAWDLWECWNDAEHKRLQDLSRIRFNDLVAQEILEFNSSPVQDFAEFFTDRLRESVSNHGNEAYQSAWLRNVHAKCT